MSVFMIAAVVASVVALSCGFALFAAFRVNHEPLSRLATGAAPLQLAAGNPMPSVGPPAPANSFGNRFPLNQADSAGASPQATPQQPDHDDSVEPPSAVAATTATVPEAERRRAGAAAPVAQAPAAEPDAKPDEVAATPSEPPPATPSEPPPAATETAATEPPAEPAASAEPVAPTAPRTSQPRTPARNPILTPSPTPRRRLRPSRHRRRPTPRPPTGTTLPPRRNVRARRRAIAPPGNPPESAARWCRCRTARPPGRNAPAKSGHPFSRSASLPASAARSCRRRPIERRPISARD